MRLRPHRVADVKSAARGDQGFQLVDGSIQTRADLGRRRGTVQEIQGRMQVIKCGPQHSLPAIGVPWHLRFPLPSAAFVAI